MSLIESNVRAEERVRQASSGFGSVVGETHGRSVTVLVAAADNDGPCGLSAADLASFESEKTREKLKLKADHVAKFHRKVVRRLATEKRAAPAHTRGGRAVKAQIGSADSFANFGDRLEPRGVAPREAQGTPWEHALPRDEAPSFQAIKVIGVRGHKGSLADADTESRMALAAYRRR
ncbi:unnamed protein product [Ectocarpus sp. 6 AP-2014]